jgi:site-specific DNA recombinase
MKDLEQERRFDCMAKTIEQVYRVGIYCRLSKDDGTDNESASIATQKSILTEYVKKQGWHLTKTYVDDGYSGTNFQRPNFQNMVKDIENGLINCVITKDLSRLGRNYLDCGLYLEVFFPEHNVRYIAVNDGVDTLNKSAMDITPFRNILNEMYSADVSVKIKSAYRARFNQGKFMGTSAPYGYVKDPADHNHLLIDDKVAHVVREIFDLALAGNGIAKIRKYLNTQHILRPAAYAVERGETGYERHFEDNEDNRYIWSENSVRQILRSPIYAGNLVGYKRIAANMKSKKRPSKLPEEWEVIPDTHEGIVTQEEFDTVQQMMTSRRRQENAGGFENIFAGIIKCADCGYAMRAMSAHRRKRPDIIDCVQYSCNNYGRYGNVECTAHTIEARDLFNAVLADINRFADMAVNDERAVKAIERKLTETDRSKARTLEKERRKLNKRLMELDRLFSALYEDKVMERITERNFDMMSEKYQNEQLEVETRLKEVSETLNESYEKSQGIQDFLSLIRNYQGLTELSASVVNALIDKILVSERETLSDGTVQQEIKIYYKFIGFVGELHITPTKRWTALPEKHCAVCGVRYIPGSAVSKYCPICAKKVQREKSNESKRRSRERSRRVCIELSAKNDRLIWNSGKAGLNAKEICSQRWRFTAM